MDDQFVGDEFAALGQTLYDIDAWTQLFLACVLDELPVYGVNPCDSDDFIVFTFLNARHFNIDIIISIRCESKVRLAVFVNRGQLVCVDAKVALVIIGGGITWHFDDFCILGDFLIAVEIVMQR